MKEKKVIWRERFFFPPSRHSREGGGGVLARTAEENNNNNNNNNNNVLVNNLEGKLSNTTHTKYSKQCDKITFNNYINKQITQQDIIQ